MQLELVDDLAAYLNGQVKRIKQRKVKFIPLDEQSAAFLLPSI